MRVRKIRKETREKNLHHDSSSSSGFGDYSSNDCREEGGWKQ